MKVCAIGLGRLGLAWSLVADQAGHEVVGVDVDRSVVDAVNSHTVRTLEPGVIEMLKHPNCSLRATTSIADGVAGAEASVIMVPTPGHADGSLSLGAVLDVVAAIGRLVDRAADPHVVVLMSTVSPGSTAGVVRTTLEQARSGGSKFRVGLAYSPEFHAIGSIVRDIRQPDRLIVGAEEAWAGDVATQLVESLLASPVVTRRVSPTEAELAKLLNNCYLTMKISYANFAAELCEAYGANSGVVCDVLGDDPRIGSSCLRPGAPFGGPCYPFDNPVLSASARAVGVVPHIPEAVQAVNERSYGQLEQLIMAATGGTVGFVGLAFKAGTADTEGSPGIELARRVAAKGRKVLVYDPALADNESLVPGADVAYSLADLVASCNVVVLTNDDPMLASQVAVVNQSKPQAAVVVNSWSGASS
jgi:UDPglucose 6-dehydrogenase